jgi:SAM-dependent methyltransferase
MDNRRFWNERYESLPALGSGPGSRAHSAWIKRRLIERYIAERGVRSILDFGCGDMFWFPATASGIAYTGVDISDVIIASNRQRLPHCEFLHHDIAAAALQRNADLVTCFDVLIHQLEPRQFRSMLANVLASTKHLALISYATPPAESSPATTDAPENVLFEQRELQLFLENAEFPRAETVYHGELPAAIRDIAPHARIEPVGAYFRQQTIYEVALP